MLRSEQINEIAAALVAAQANLTNPPRNRDVTVKTKPKQEGGKWGEYTFKYATLDSIYDLIRKPLTDAGLCWLHALEDKKVITYLLHSSGQFIGSEFVIMTEGAGNQAVGSAITYGKRYGITTLLGLASDEDDDANAADGNEAQGRDRKPPANRARTASPSQSTPFDTDPLRILVPIGDMPPDEDGEVRKGADWTAWGAAFKQAIMAADSVAKVNAIAKANAVAMKTMEEVDPEGAKLLKDRCAHRRAALSQAPEISGNGWKRTEADGNG